MKVLFVTNLYPSQQEPNRGVYIQNQVRALRNAGYEICVLQMDYRSIRRRRKLGCNWRNQEDVEVCHFSVPVSPFHRIQYRLAGLFTYMALKCVEKRRGKFDLFHGHFLEGAYGLRKISKRNGIPLIVTEHGSNLLDSNRSHEDQRRMEKLYSAADKLILVSQAQAQRADGFAVKSSAVIHNVIPSYVKYENCPKDTCFQFIAVGNLIESKRFGRLIEAFVHLYKTHKNVRLVIVGTGPLESQLKQDVIRHGVSEVVEFKGAIPNRELVHLYNEANCFVLPSQFETFGVVYAEALCTGTPIISTKNGGINEIFEEGSGMLIDVDDIEALKDAMERMLTFEVDAEKLALKYQEKFGDGAFVDKIENVYREVLCAKGLRHE